MISEKKKLESLDNMFIVYFRIISELSTHGQTDGI
jgi:hypothetical protein